MVRSLILSLALLISAPSFAAYVPANGAPAIGLGATGAANAPLSTVPLGQVSASSQQIFSLFVGGSMTSGNFYPLYKNGTAYQVPSGKTAYCFNIRSSSETGAIRWQIVSDTVAISWNQSSALTSGLFQGGATAQLPLRTGTTANVPYVNPGVFSVAQNRYMAIQINTTLVAEFGMDCFEQ